MTDPASAGASGSCQATSACSGSGVGRELLDAARRRLAGWGAHVMTISVIAGNAAAVRFYRREVSAVMLPGAGPPAAAG